MADDEVMTSRSPQRAEVLAAEIDAVVAAMAASRWPTTPEEFAGWANAVGLSCPLAEPDIDCDALMPASHHFRAPGHPWNLGWHFHRGAFVGVTVFPGDGLDPLELRRLATALRDRFDAHWEAAESLHDVPPLTGFTSNWLPGVCLVDLYWHAPRIDPLGCPSNGAVQLAITHAARAQAEDDEAAHAPS